MAKSQARSHEALHAMAASCKVAQRAVQRFVGQRELLQEVWGPAYGEETHYLRVYLAAVRRKLEPVPGQPRYFLTEAGRGYRFHEG